jgi:hypothetical protein
MLENIMASSVHISVKGDMGQSNVVADFFAWCSKMGRTGIAMEQQVLNIDEINNILRWQMGFSEKRKASVKSTLELMTWIRERYANSVADLKNKTERADTGGNSKKDLQDDIVDLEENEKKVTELINQIRAKLSVPEGATMSQGSLRQIRQKAAQLSETVANVEKTNRRRPMTHREPPKELTERVCQLKSQMSPGAVGRRWVVVGCGDSGGIVVQSGSEALSADFEGRLSTGAMVEEIAVQDGKVLFQNISGDGPTCGWVTLMLDGVPSLVEVMDTELE